MTDPVVRARGIVDSMERSDVVALRAVLPQRHWDWLDSYVSESGGWQRIKYFAGSPRAVVSARALSPVMARVVIQGERGQGFVTVRFGEDDELIGFALYGEEFEGIGTVVITCPRERRQELAAFYDALLGTDPRRLPQLGFGGGKDYLPPRWPSHEAPQQNPPRHSGGKPGGGIGVRNLERRRSAAGRW